MILPKSLIKQAQIVIFKFYVYLISVKFGDPQPTTLFSFNITLALATTIGRVYFHNSGKGMSAAPYMSGFIFRFAVFFTPLFDLRESYNC